MHITNKDKENFLSRLVRNKETGCLLWTGYRMKKGYGQLKIGLPGKRKSEYAHRVAWVLSGKSIKKNRPNILHRCDIRDCCEPSHLFDGTQSDNAIDMAKKNRGTRSKNGLPKGVYERKNGSFRARIRVFDEHRIGKNVNLGTFETAKEAELATHRLAEEQYET